MWSFIPIRLWRWLRTHQTPIALVALGLVVPILTGCAAKSEIHAIEANQTAFLIPLTSDPSKQQQLQSIDFLKKNQVAVKLVTIPFEWRSTGGFLGSSGDWYPSVKLEIVDRTLVTREWTKSAATGTSPSDQAFGVESSESIDFKVGATCTAIITEEDAATYLYYYGNKPLSEVMDQDVRGFIQQQLFNEFGSRPLAQGQTDKKVIFQSVGQLLTDTFLKKGITILSFGGSEGLTYTDPKIQDAINQSYAAQQAVVQAQAAATQQSFVNQQIVSQADAQATATVIAGAAQSQVMQQSGETLARYPGLTNYILAQKSNGQVPQILVLGGQQNGSLPFSFLLPPIETPTPAPTPGK
jgi:hypothetical protein